jgi:hypothetical protein
MSKTPDEVVAERIALELRDLGLIEIGRIEKFSASLATGRLKVSDWNLLAESFENGTARSEQGE